jgi:predicted Rossmann fold nucleotide-binding protein DprA/Smf involved in DNA uptake
VCSPLSHGPHALLAQGARLVCNAQDALDALYGVGVASAADETPVSKPTTHATTLAPELQLVFEQVGAGRDTIAKLTAQGTDAQDTAVALAELELVGMLVRGDGGRYLPRA